LARLRIARPLAPATLASAVLAAATVALGLGASSPARAAGDEMRGLVGPYLAARAARQVNDYDAAARYYARALVRDPRNGELLQNAIISQMGLGNLTRAVPIARQLRGTGADNQIANLVIMADQLVSEDWTAVLEDLDAGMTVGPLVDGLIHAWAELGAGDADAAEDVFDASAEQTGLAAFGLYHKALARAVSGDFEGAETILSGEEGRRLGLTTRGVVAHAQILSQLGRNEEAIALLDESFGADLSPRLAALRAELEAGEAVPFTLIRGPRDGAAEVFYTVAGALSGEATDSYTLLYARTAEALRPGHVDAILLSAGLLEQMGQFDLATEAYKSVPREDPSFHVAELGRAEALRRSGREDEAIEVLEALQDSHGDQAIVHITLGDTLRQMERYDAATEAYDEAVSLFTEDREEHWIVYFARGITHEREDRWPEAEADFRKALELNPGQPSVLNYLGYSFIEMQENLDEAMEMIREAVAARPDSGHIVDSLGWGLYRLGRYEEAVEHMERAAELLPVDPIVNDHLGDVYWAVGRRTEARFQWQRALSFEPEEEDAERIRRKLEVGLDQVLAEEGAPPLDLAGEGNSDGG
jgi:tetratricopeptide (TPR) repeat protein